jgi:hypothetical protein
MPTTRLIRCTNGTSDTWTRRGGHSASRMMASRMTASCMTASRMMDDTWTRHRARGCRL